MWKRLVRLWSVARGDALVLWHALRHPQAPRWLHLGCIGLVGYLMLPVDLIPDVIPVIGWADDLVLIPLAMAWLLRRLPAQVRDDAMARAGRGPASASRQRPPLAERVR